MEQLSETIMGVYHCIVRYKRMNDGNSPNYRQIADATGIKLKQVKASLKVLEQAALLEPTPGFQRGRARHIQVKGGRWDLVMSGEE